MSTAQVKVSLSSGIYTEDDLIHLLEQLRKRNREPIQVHLSREELVKVLEATDKEIVDITRRAENQGKSTAQYQKVITYKDNAIQEKDKEIERLQFLLKDSQDSIEYSDRGWQEQLEYKHQEIKSLRQELAKTKVLLANQPKYESSTLLHQLQNNLDTEKTNSVYWKAKYDTLKNTVLCFLGDYHSLSKSIRNLM